MIRKLAHLCFHTNDLPRMVDFYTNKLGLPVKFTLDNAERVAFGYYIACGDTSFIEIFDHKLAIKQWGGQIHDLLGRGPYAHFCLEVTGLRDLKAALEHNGVKVSDVKTGMDHSLQAWINDPDGNAIELMEYTAHSRQIPQAK